MSAKHLLTMTACRLAVSAGSRAETPTAADKLGWRMAVHSYTFMNFSIREVIAKTAALGLKDILQRDLRGTRGAAVTRGAS